MFVSDKGQFADEMGALHTDPHQHGLNNMESGKAPFFDPDLYQHARSGLCAYFAKRIGVLCGGPTAPTGRAGSKGHGKVYLMQSGNEQMDVNTKITDTQCHACLRVAEADHRIANHLAMLASYVRLKSSKLVQRKPTITSEEALVVVKAIGLQIDAVSHLHRFLARDDTSDKMELCTYLATICAALRSAVEGDVDIIESFDRTCVIPPSYLLPVSQIVTEMMTNAIKHGKDPSGQVSLRVSCRHDASGSIVIEVCDNGPGLKTQPDAVKQLGLGLRIVETLTARVNGTIAYRSGPTGLSVQLTVPDVHG
jgi:two-component sensor histidine kinase